MRDQSCLFLGTAGSIPSYSRDNTSLLLHTTRKEYILIDCPGCIAQKLLQAGVDYRNIRQIILTHEHPDHIYGLPSLIHCLSMAKTPAVHIYSSARGIMTAKALLKTLNLPSRRSRIRLYYTDTSKKNPFYQSGQMEIRAFQNLHIRHSFGICALFRKKYRTLIYSSDTGPSSIVIKESRNADYLIHDCSGDSRYFRGRPTDFGKKHTSAIGLSHIASAAGVKTLIPIHFYGSSAGFFGRIRKELRTRYTGRIIIPSDLQVLEIV